MSNDTPTPEQAGACFACGHLHDPASAGGCADATCLPTCVECLDPEARYTVHVSHRKAPLASMSGRALALYVTGDKWRDTNRIVKTGGANR
jgi:hypothetical protein